MHTQQAEIEGVEYRWSTKPYGDGQFTATWWCDGEPERHELAYGLNSHTAVSAEIQKLIREHRRKIRTQGK